MKDWPDPISTAEMEERLRRISANSAGLVFVGSVEYRHVYSRSGGAQYCIGPSADDDIMVVYAEAFEREANPEDFSLEAMIAHECGHQRLHRDPRFRTIAAKFPGRDFEEILASLAGSLIVDDPDAAETLVAKATMELGNLRVSPESAVPFIDRLRKLLEHCL